MMSDGVKTCILQLHCISLVETEMQRSWKMKIDLVILLVVVVGWWVPVWTYKCGDEAQCECVKEDVKCGGDGDLVKVSLILRSSRGGRILDVRNNKIKDVYLKNVKGFQKVLLGGNPVECDLDWPTYVVTDCPVVVPTSEPQDEKMESSLQVQVILMWVVVGVLVLV